MNSTMIATFAILFASGKSLEITATLLTGDFNPLLAAHLIMGQMSHSTHTESNSEKVTTESTGSAKPKLPTIPGLDMSKLQGAFGGLQKLFQGQQMQELVAKIQPAMKQLVEQSTQQITHLIEKVPQNLNVFDPQTVAPLVAQFSQSFSQSPLGKIFAGFGKDSDK